MNTKPLAVTGSAYSTTAFSLVVPGGSVRPVSAASTESNQPPVVTAPAHTLPVGQNGPDTIPVVLSWSATDEDGIAGYELQQSTDGGATFTNMPLPTCITTTLTLSITPNGAGQHWDFAVRATDRLGAVSDYKAGPAFKVETYQESASAVVYAGAWKADSVSGAYGDSVTYASTAAAKATFTFTGSSVSWVSTRGTDRGKAEVWLDGTKKATINLYASSRNVRQTVYAINGLSTNTSHNLEIRVVGEKDPSSSSTRIDIDGFIALRFINDPTGLPF